jgi:hypothetical protein
VSKIFYTCLLCGEDKMNDERVLAGVVREAEKQRVKERQIKGYVPHGRHKGIETWSVS